MRVLVSLMGPDGGVLVDDERSTTRAALASIPHDTVHVLALNPDDPEVEAIGQLCERTGAELAVDPVPGEDLKAAFERILEVVEGHAGREDVEVHVHVNAGRGANLLSAAGLLACLHAGTSAHFVHEEGHDELGVVTRAPLSPRLEPSAVDALSGFPDEGVALDEAGARDAAALNALKDDGLIEREADRLVLTDRGRAYRAHVRARGGRER